MQTTNAGVKRSENEATWLIKPRVLHVHIRRTLSFSVVPRKPAPKYVDSAGGMTHDLEVG